MHNKVNSILFIIYIFITSPTQGQARKKIAQVDNEYKWAVGIGLGNLCIDGDVRAVKTQLSEGIHFYKPLTKWFGIKVNFTHGNAKGQNYKPTENFGKNTAWADKYAAPRAMSTNTGVAILYGYYSNGVFIPTTKPDVVYNNYKTSINALSTSVEFTLPIPYANPRVGLHFSLGLGLLFYKAKIDALNNNGTYANLFKDIYNTYSVVGNVNSKEIINKLKNGMDNIYETDAESDKNPPHFSNHFGIGVSYRFKNRFVVGVERSRTFIKTDLLDGQRWQEAAYGDAILSRDFDNLVINNIRVSYFFN
jgi:hypothetical protein